MHNSGDTELGKDSWIDLSIPRSEALALRRANREEDELDRLEDELVRVQAALGKPGLPNGIWRVVWDANGNRREEETVGSLQREQQGLLSQIRDLSDRLPKRYERPPEFSRRKNADEQIRLHPDLALAIRRRLTKADFVFVLLTRFCRLRRWIDCEIAVCANTPSIVIGVLSGAYASRDFFIDCHEVISWDRQEIRRVLGLG